MKKYILPLIASRVSGFAISSNVKEICFGVDPFIAPFEPKNPADEIVGFDIDLDT